MEDGKGKGPLNGIFLHRFRLHSIPLPKPDFTSCNVFFFLKKKNHVWHSTYEWTPQSNHEITLLLKGKKKRESEFCA